MVINIVEIRCCKTISINIMFFFLFFLFSTIMTISSSSAILISKTNEENCCRKVCRWKFFISKIFYDVNDDKHNNFYWAHQTLKFMNFHNFYIVKSIWFYYLQHYQKNETIILKWLLHGNFSMYSITNVWIIW